MKIQLLICAREFVIDQGSNLVSAFNIYELVPTVAFPFITPMFSVLTIAVHEDNEPDAITVQMRIANEDHELFSGDLELVFSGANRVRNIVQFGPMLILKPGNISVTLRSANKELASYLIGVTAVAPVAAKPQKNDPGITDSHGKATRVKRETGKLSASSKDRPRKG